MLISYYRGYSNKLQKEIMLKLCRPNYQVKKEANMLNKYGEIACKCYYKNEEDRVLVLEKLIPGDTLNQIPEREERIKEFTKLMKKTVLEIEEGEYSTYQERIEKSLKSAMENPLKYGDTAQFVPIAYEYYQEIQKLGLKKYILHGDLNLRNIVKSGNTWKLIDPQGVIAEGIFEVVKVVRGELENSSNVKQTLEETIHYLSQELSYSEELLAKVVFVELVRINCWRTNEDNNREFINRNILFAKEVLQHCL